MGILHLNSLHLSAYVISLVDSEWYSVLSVVQDWLSCRPSCMWQQCCEPKETTNRKHGFQYVHKTVMVCRETVPMSKAQNFKIIKIRTLVWTLWQYVWVIFTKGCVCLCLKGELFIVSLLLFSSFKMYFYGIIVTELQPCVTWLWTAKCIFFFVIWQIKL